MKIIPIFALSIFIYNFSFIFQSFTKMKQQLTLFAFLLVAYCADAQITTTRSFNTNGVGIVRFVSAGGSLTDGATVRINFTAGEPIYPPYQPPNAPIRINSGFQAAAVQTAALTPVTENLGISKIQVFPNPAADYLNITLQSTETGKCNLILMSLTGVLLRQETVSLNTDGTSTLQINIADLPAAPYILTFTKDNQLVQSFKIIKN